MAEQSTLSDQAKSLIRAAYTTVADNQPGFRPRAPQRRMIAEVSKTLAGDYGSRILAIEGPTGVGKSLAYLIGALPVALERKKYLIVATATVALQEQLMRKDLPDLRAHSGLAFTFELAKGRRRYVCDRNLAQLAHDEGAQGDLGDTDSEGSWNPGGQGLWRVRPQPGEPELVRRMQAAREQRRWNGDLDAWDEPPAEPLREMLTTNSASCTHKRCQFHDQCPFYAARRDLHGADVIVANHALVLSDLMMGGGVVLPEPEDCVYIFDEGHHLHRVALDLGAAATHLLGPRQWLDNIARSSRDLFKLLPHQAYRADLQRYEEAVHKDVPALMDRLQELHQFVDGYFPKDTSPARGKSGPWGNEAEVWRFPMGRIESLELVDAFDNTAKAAALVRKLVARMTGLVDKALKDDAIQEVQASPVLSGLVWTLGRIANTETALARLAEVDDPDSPAPPCARWITRVKDGQDYAVAASPTSAAALLRGLLWARCDGAVLTSATLTSLGRFDRLCEQSGLDADTIRTHKLDSPFDYRHRARLVIPAMKTLPSEREAFTDEIADLMSDGLIADYEGTLVLFSSYWQMRAVWQRLARTLADRVLMQGEAARAQLLQTHKQRIDKGEGSALFGVASFAEGLDLPGALCRHVIVTKLPFSVPDSPTEATYAEWLESVGRNSFMEMSVPDASLRLIQACGRLLRTESDEGRVTILDRRLVTKRYGRAMLDALPPFRREIAPGASAA